MLKAIVPTSVGRDRIADLYGPGDVLGTAALSGETHAETVVAIHDATLVPVDPAQSMNDRRLRDAILQSLALQLRRGREVMDDAELPVGCPRDPRLLCASASASGKARTTRWA